MIKRLSMGLWVGALALGAGCGSGASRPPLRDCGKDGFICNPPGLPFVQAAVAVSDLCGGLVVSCDLSMNPPLGATTAHLSVDAGKLCLSGTVRVGGWAGVALPFATINNEEMNTILTTLNADARGITQVGFTIDSPLAGAFTMAASTTPPPPVECQNLDCVTGFDLATAPLSGVLMTFTQPGPVVAPFASFESSPQAKFDTTSIEGVGFNPATFGDYAFCISDFKLLNAAGNEVKP